ncbi:MAG: acyl-[ACP]--phospholipid O-acyltransferase, partial [Alphaproteobacteria bacterium]
MQNEVSIASLLKTKRFFPLFICQFFSAFSDTLIRTAMVTLITYYSTELSPFTRSLVINLALGLFMFPFVFFSSTGGQLADRFDKSLLIRIIKFSSIFVTLVGVLGFYFQSYTLLLIAIFLTGIEAALFGPSKYSILPDHLEKNELILGNGLIEAGTFMAILLGMILGGVLISNQNGQVDHTIFVLMAVAIFGFIASLFIPKTNEASPNLKLSYNIFKETTKCVNYARGEKDTFLAILGISWFWLIGGVFLSQIPNFTKDILGSDDSVFIMLLTMFSLGTGLGSALCNRILKGVINLQYVPISMLLMTIFLFLIWSSSTFFETKTTVRGLHYFLSDIYGIIITLSVFLVSFFGGIYIVPLYAFMQVNSKRSHRSRVIATNNIMNALFMVIASIITMCLIALNISISDLILIMCLTNFFTTIYIARILPDNIIKSIIQTLFRIIYRVEIVGLEHFMNVGDRVLIVANHASFLDPPLLGAFLPKRLVFAIDTFQAKSWWIKPFLTYLRAYPIDPSNPMATKTIIEKLRDGHPVVIFPEGRITVTGSLMKIYEGPGLIADKADAKILPIRIDGPQYSHFSRLHGKIKLRLFPKFKITILEPRTIKVPNNTVGRYRRHIIGKELYDIMSNMMFEGSENKHTLFESLIEAQDQFGSKYSIVEDADHNRFNYRRIVQGSFVLGKKIAGLTHSREYVGLFLPNAAGAIVTFFAIQAYGRIPAMLNFSTGIKNLIACCQAAKIKTVFTSRRFVEKAQLEDQIEGMEKECIKVYYLEDIRTSITLAEKLCGVLGSLFALSFYKRITKAHTIKPLDPAVVIFTSGSEGVPKGVVLSHANLQANIKQAASRVDFSSSDKVFNALPIFHSFGLTGGFLMPVLSGVKVFLYPSPLHYRIIPEMVYGSNATVMFGTDTFLSGYVKHAHPYDFFSIRYIFAGAEKLRSETKQAYMDKFGIRIFEGYGVTEASPVVAINTPMHYKAGTVGRLIPNIKYHIDPVEGIKEGGKLIISGPNIMLGYLKT